METREIIRQSSIDDHKEMIAVNNKRYSSKKNNHAKSRRFFFLFLLNSQVFHVNQHDYTCT